MPKISIVTINYNDHAGLQETFASVFGQSFQDFEYIVIDGGSSDGSREIIERNASKIAYWVSEKDKGIYNAMNKGIERASGDYILALNSGDALHSQSTLKEVLPHLTGEDIIYGNSYDMNFSGPSGGKLIRYPSELSFKFFFKDSLRHQATFIRKSLYKKMGGYDETYRIAADGKFLVTALAKENATYKHVDLPICNYDRTGISSVNMMMALDERGRFFKEGFPFHYKDYQDSIRQAMVDGPIRFGAENKPLGAMLKMAIKCLLPYGVVRAIQHFRLKS